MLVNHYPLQRDHAVLPRIPRFSPWCGTRLTEGWHQRFRAVAVVYGHLHVRCSFEQDGVAFHEVSLGYPGQWNGAIDDYLPSHSLICSTRGRPRLLNNRWRE